MYKELDSIIKQNDIKSDANQECKDIEDLSGKNRLIFNVIFSWAAHMVFIVTGFIMPRMIDHHLGQSLLGVWDFAWSLVSYYSLVQGGIGSSVNRYVAKYRAMNDTFGINSIVSSVTLLLIIAGLLVVGLTIMVSLLLPRYFGTRLEGDMADAQWVLLFLGFCMAVEMALSGFIGVLTGCHRWELHNTIKSGCHFLTVVAMITSLLLGGGLPQLAMAYLIGQIIASIMRVIVAHRVCHGLQVRPSFIRKSTIRSIFVFGGKTLIPSVSNLLLNQTMSILIVAYLGPSMLALYSRPHSLILHIRTLVNKMAFVLTPMASSLQSTGNLEEIRALLLKSVRYSLYMVLPMVLVLVIFGGTILRLWMGADYANNLLPAVLAGGYLAAMVNLPLISILAGMNAHGRAGIAQLITSICSVGLTILVLGPLGSGLVGTALAITVPLTIMNVVYLPFYICRRLDLHLWKYFTGVLVKPVVYVIPFALCLITSRFQFADKPLIGLACGLGIGCCVLAILYWKYVLPSQIKTWTLRLLRIEK